MPPIVEFPPLTWACACTGVPVPPPIGSCRPHTALYDARLHASLYERLLAMADRGAIITLLDRLAVDATRDGLMR